jgi:hypothetical protein
MDLERRVERRTGTVGRSALIVPAALINAADPGGMC